jgi:hypothetical protein
MDARHNFECGFQLWFDNKPLDLLLVQGRARRLSNGAFRTGSIVITAPPSAGLPPKVQIDAASMIVAIVFLVAAFFFPPARAPATLAREIVLDTLAPAEF